jgi:hypothetical protein
MDMVFIGFCIYNNFNTGDNLMVAHKDGKDDMKSKKHVHIERNYTRECIYTSLLQVLEANSNFLLTNHVTNYASWI